MSSIKDQIRAEIDRRYEENRGRARYNDYYRGMNDGLDHLEQFLDTLPEQPVEGLEEAAEEYGKRQGLELKPFAIKFFKAGAEWMKAKMEGKI